jgi:hypothetical protein
VARFSSTGSLDATLNPTLSDGATIVSAAALSDGRIVIGGDFSSVNGVSRGNIAAFLTTGALDPVFAATAGTNGTVRQISIRPPGGVFVAGGFTSVGIERRNGITALTASGTVDTSFVPSQLTTGDVVQAFAALPDGGLVVAVPAVPKRTPTGIAFPRTQLRRLTATGEIDPSFVFSLDVNATFTAMTSDAQGRVVAGFTGIDKLAFGGNVLHYSLLRFASSGAVDATFNVGVGPAGPVTSLGFAPDGTLYAAGPFGRFDDLPAGFVTRLHFDVDQSPSSLLLNISTRGDSDNLTAGFVIGGTTPKTVLVRAVGPSLGAFGITGPLHDPLITLYRISGSATNIGSNDNWSSPPTFRNDPVDVGFTIALTSARVGAFPLQSNLDAALVATLPPGAYTAQVSSTNGPTARGVALVEIYDANAFTADRRIVNISTRGNVAPGEQTLIAGFVISGTDPKQVLIRAAGPGLEPFNVKGTLPDPMLTVADSAGAIVATNNDWGTNTNAIDIALAATKVGAFPFTAASKDAAALVNLKPGAYTALVTGAKSTTGVALVEVYEVR